MPSKRSDQEIVAFITNELNIQPTVEYNEAGDLLTLNLSNLGLQQLPAEIAQLTSLQQLDLSVNQLSQIPAEIDQLTSLQQLDLSGNQLSQLPAELCQLTSLQVLSLSGNQLSQLPAEIGQLTSLQQLGLDDNPSLLTPPLKLLLEAQEISSLSFENCNSIALNDMSLSFSL